MDKTQRDEKGRFVKGSSGFRQHHSEKTKMKLRLDKQGKTYEEIYDQETAKRKRQESSERLLKNPIKNRKSFPKGHKINNGRIPWNKDKKMPEEQANEHSIILKEKYASGEITTWNKGKSKEDYPQLSNSGVKKGNIPFNKNKTNEELYGKEKAEQLKQENSETHKKLWSNPEYKNIQLKKMRTQHKPTSPERKLIEIIQKNNLPFNYVGDGKIWFQGDNNHFNPDFLSMNPKHIIEVFGTYWHSLPRVIEKDKNSLKAYSKYGYKTLVIWEHELVKRHNYPLPLSEQEIVSRINQFVKS